MTDRSRLTKTQDAALALADLLGDGEWRPAREMFDVLAQHRLDHPRVVTAAGRLAGVQKRKRSGKRGPWEWRIPPGTPPPVIEQPAPPRAAVAAELLRDRLDGEWRPARPILDDLAAAGFVRSAVVAEACRLAGVQKRRRRGGWEWRLAPDGEALGPRSSVCVLCGSAIESSRGRRYCDARCRVEGNRLEAILRGDDRAEYGSLAARLAGVARPGARRRSGLPDGPGPLERLLAAAGLQRREDEGRAG